MSTVIDPELTARIDACSPSEKGVLLGRLAVALMPTFGAKPVAVHDEAEKTIAYLLPGDGSANWPLPPETPERMAELRRRIDSPGETIPFDDFMNRVETESRTRR